MTKTMNTRSATAVDVHVGRRLKALRRGHDLSQTQLGGHVDVTFQQIQKYEKGVNRISVSRLWRFCEYFDVRPDYFFEGLLEVSRETEGLKTPYILQNFCQDTSFGSQPLTLLKMA